MTLPSQFDVLLPHLVCALLSVVSPKPSRTSSELLFFVQFSNTFFSLQLPFIFFPYVFKSLNAIFSHFFVDLSLPLSTMPSSSTSSPPSSSSSDLIFSFPFSNFSF